MSESVTFQEAMQKAVHVSDEVSLKTAVQQGKLVIISSDPELYKKMLQKFPKEKVTKSASKAGKVMVGVGAAVAVVTGGIFGLPLAGLGLLSGAAGSLLDDYKNYTIRMDYEQQQVQFVKTKGDPHVKLEGK